MDWLRRKEFKILMASVLILAIGMVLLIRLTLLPISIDFMILVGCSLLLSWFNFGLMDFAISYFHLWKLLMLPTMMLMTVYELIFQWAALSDIDRLLYLMAAVASFIGLFSCRLVPHQCQCGPYFDKSIK